MIEVARSIVVGDIRLEPDDRHNRDLVANVHPPAWANPQPSGRYDLVVIGAGTAGLVSAAGAAGLGARVALVERAFMGGDCLNFGCVPSKALLRAARAWHATRSGVSLGAPAGASDGDFARAMERLRGLRAELSHNDSAERFRRLGVDVFFGEARFGGADRVRVDGTVLEFRRAVIATGAKPTVPPIPGLETAPYRTNETIFSLESLPPRLGVIGAGPIGCELAQAFARLGSRVTLVDRDSRVLPREDPDAAGVVERSLGRDGVRFLGGASIARVSADKRTITLAFSTPTQPAEELVIDELLVSVGRAANVAGLDLERAGVAYSATGVEVDARLRTTNRRVYACGDVASRFQFTHAADAGARVVIQNALFLGRARADRLNIPWCTYTEPEIAHVGIHSEEAAIDASIATLDVPFSDVDRARLDGADDGFLRLHVLKKSGAIRGATIVGERAGELIGQVTLAMNANVPLGKIAATIYPYPTYGEAIKKAADAWRRTKLTPAARRILGIVRTLGTRV